MLPSVRGRRRFVTSAILLSALIIGALIISLAARAALAWVHLGDAALSRWAAALVIAGVALDLSGIPALDVGTQVPQAWGHRHGPIAAAARYGLRLGVAPGTILTTWLWWSGLVIAGLSSWSVAIVSALSFAVVRFLTMAVVAAGADDGVTMARRMTAWRGAESTFARVGLAVATLGAAASLLTA